MMPLIKNQSREDYYSTQSKGQLIIYLLNSDEVNRELMSKLELLTGCGKLGEQDGTDGACVECFHDNNLLWNRCKLFRQTFKDFQKWKEIRKRG